MEVTSLCIRLLINGLMLLVAHVQQSYAQTSESDAALRIVPNHLQVFEYGSVSFTCEGFNVSAGWKVRNINENLKYCSDDTEMSTVTCTIDRAFTSDSGEYWCEGGGGERSNTVNITVTAGSVILDSPVLPVMEGDAVTLRCRNKDTSSNITADFYKDGHLIGSRRPTGHMTIERVSMSDDGLYKCNISAAGESPGSRLAVRGKDGDVILEIPALPVMEGHVVILRCRQQEASSDLTATFYKDGHFIRSSPTGEMIIHSVSKSDEGVYKCSIPRAGESPGRRLSVKEEMPAIFPASHKKMIFSHPHYILLWFLIAAALALQLLVLGLLYWKKRLVSVLLEAKKNDPNNEMQELIRRDKKTKDTADAADNLSLYLETNRSTEPQTEKDQREPVPQSFHSTFMVDDAAPGLRNESEASSSPVTEAPPEPTDLPLQDLDPEYAAVNEILEEETCY